MQDFGKSTNAIVVANCLLGVNALLHYISTGKILDWGTYLDIEAQQQQHNPFQTNYYYQNRVPIAEYLIIIGIFMLVSACLSLAAYLLKGERTFAFCLIVWFANVFGSVFNFAAGVFLMIWVSFNNRGFNTNHIIFADQPVEYRSMYITIALDASYTLVLGAISSVILFTQDSYLLAKTKIVYVVENTPTGRRASQLPKLTI